MLLFILLLLVPSTRPASQRRTKGVCRRQAGRRGRREKAKGRRESREKGRQGKGGKEEEQGRGPGRGEAGDSSSGLMV